MSWSSSESKFSNSPSSEQKVAVADAGCDENFLLASRLGMGVTEWMTVWFQSRVGSQRSQNHKTHFLVQILEEPRLVLLGFDELNGKETRLID